jgi:twinkle protein
MTKIVGDTGCPRCIENGNDKTENHLMMFEDGGAYCNRCMYTTNWKEQDIPVKERKELSDEELQDVLSEFRECPVKPYSDRGISLQTVERFGCRAGVHPSDRSKIGNYLLPVRSKSGSGKTELTGYKVGIPEDQRKPDLPKYFNRGRVRDAVLFGEELLPDQPFKKLFITEAPMDALALYQAIKESNAGGKWAELEPNVVALPHGTGCVVEAIDRSKDKLKLAEEIILVFDNDKAGNEAVEKAKSLIPNVKSVKLPSGDCNDMLLEGKGNALAKLCMWGSEAVKLDSVIDIGDIEDDIVKKPTWGKPYPWPSLTNLTYGKRTKEIVGIAAGVGIGKSDFKYQMMVEDVKDPNVKVGVFDLEATAGKTGKAVIGKIKHMLLHKPDVEYDEEEIRAAARELAGKIKIYSHKGSRDWKEIRTAIRHMVVVDGCTEIYMDNMTSLVSSLSSAEANDVLNNIMGELASMVEELDFNFTYFAHLNPPKTGPSHERGGKVHENQLTGSRAMIKWSHYIMGLERNKDPDLPEYERNTTTVVLLKDREFGNVGKFRVFYNKETGDLVEMFA